MNIPLGNPLAGGFRVRRQKFGVGQLVIMLLIGGIFAFAGTLLIRSAQIDGSWARVQGRVVDVSSRISDGSTQYTPVVEYQVDGRSYRVTGNMSSSAYPTLGGQREVAYNPEQPMQAKVVGDTFENIFVLIFPVIGYGLMLLAPFLYFRSLKRSSHIKHLMQAGQRLQGVLVDIRATGSMGDGKGYRIEVAATAPDGSVQHYTSDMVSGVGGLMMSDFQSSPVPIDVYVNPADPKDYYVDISDIPNLTPQRITELIAAAVSRQQQPQTIVSGPLVPPPVPVPAPTAQPPFTTLPPRE